MQARSGFAAVVSALVLLIGARPAHAGLRYCLPLDMSVEEKEAILDPDSPTYDPDADDCDPPSYDWETSTFPCLASVGQSCTTVGETICQYGQGAIRAMLRALLKDRTLSAAALAGIETCLRDGVTVQGIWYPYGFGVQCSGDFMGNLTYTVFSADAL